MATRFYLSSTAAAPVSPAFLGTWTYTTEGDRRSMAITKDASAMTDKTFFNGGTIAVDESALARQFVSAQMAAGVAFNTVDTFKLQVRCREQNGGDNISQLMLGIKVYSSDGSTLRATLLALGFYGPSAVEWSATALTNKQGHHPSFSLDGGYTTVADDRLVIEVGGKVNVGGAGGTTVTGTMSFGSDNATDLPEDESTTTANNPWFEISRDITFQSGETFYLSHFQDLESGIGQHPAIAINGLIQF